MTPHIAQRLRDTSDALQSERVSMQALAQAHGPEAHGSLLLLMAVPCLLPIPGVGTLLGLGMAALALTMWRGHAAARLPRRVGQLELTRPCAQRVLGMLAATCAMAGRFAKERHTHWTSAGPHSWMSAVIGLMALLVVLPIPFGNLLPALAVMLIALGMVLRDGFAALLGLLMAALALAFAAGLMLLAWTYGSEWALHWNTS